MRRPTFAVGIAAMLVLTVTACRTDSSGFAPVYNAIDSRIVLDGVDTAGNGHVGLDIAMGDPANPYNPCHERHDADGAYNDTYYSACQDSSLGRTSYFKHYNFTAGGRELANSTIMWSNHETNKCAGKPWCPAQPALMFTDFARKATYWAIEFYPYRNDEGGVRLQGAPRQAEPDRAASANLGTIRLPRAGAPGITALTGAVHNAAAGRFQIDVFQIGDFWMTTSTGYQQQGFSSNTSGNGAYASKPLPVGQYRVVVWDLATGAGYSRELRIDAGTRIDLNAAAPCAGMVPAYVPHTATRVC